MPGGSGISFLHELRRNRDWSKGGVPQPRDRAAAAGPQETEALRSEAARLVQDVSPEKLAQLVALLKAK